MATAKSLTEVDLNVKKAVKRWLHLPRCTTDGLLYAGKQDGGLNILKLSVTIPAIQARRIHKLYHSDEETVRWIAQRTIKPKTFQKLWINAGGATTCNRKLSSDPFRKKRCSQQALGFVEAHRLFKAWISDGQLTLVGV